MTKNIVHLLRPKHKTRTGAVKIMYDDNYIASTKRQLPNTKLSYEVQVMALRLFRLRLDRAQADDLQISMLIEHTIRAFQRINEDRTQ